MLKYFLSYLILPQLLVVASSSVIFSGLYEPNLFYNNAEDFAASSLKFKKINMKKSASLNMYLLVYIKIKIKNYILL